MAFTGVRLVPVNGEGPEDVVVDEQGRIYTGVADGRILRISPDGRRIDTIADTGGRPLGLELYGPDELLICDCDRGLLAVSRDGGEPRTLATEAAGRRLLATNNAAVAADGTVYFTDSSAVFPIPRWREDLIEQTGSGRLLRRAPDGTIDELLGGLQFANGVALAADESFVAVAESGACRVRRAWLTGDRAGTTDVFLDDLPAYPDNISTGSDGLIWVAKASPRVAALDVVRRLPPPLRATVRRAPVWLQPGLGRTVGVLGVAPDGRVVRERTGEIDGFHVLTAVREKDGQLYFGSLVERAIAIAPR
ncbi:Sugar lactone lactonase YvrE [Amycolatopsis arida]|uniref:Sugar lactone lactonase YvrE n=1 Tax=Amycolatopsis arida TaxID=587909 RepID=A0A1I5KVQ8_9PSEU|nr:SMP-30/gluconolactonase/LRE family protein [Amycolatopsis arida]TDX85854.1 sugar lactone lactonase YvrE [Amycolatopsis arida]SFO89033.1 Sugar lactone lactonase YvrE [Amycolatopsis arida]